MTAQGTLSQRVGQFWSDIGKHQIFTLTGSIAYTTALSLAPFILIVLSIASLLGQGFQNKIYTELSALLGGEAGNAVKLVVENADNSQGVTTFSGIVGLIILAVSASAVFTQLRTSLDAINETPAAKHSSGFMGFLKEKFFSVGLVFGFIFLLIPSLTMTTLI